MPLNIDCRPTDFKDFHGNAETVKSLKSILEREDRPKAMLFTGPSGCGKTTLARIVAKELKCSDHDFTEINISNNRGIDTAREIINGMKFKPMSGRVKIYLLDEVHKSTGDFQNALLKPLEDCPDGVYFILCTTGPEKLLKTLRNRCTTFSVEALPSKRIKRLLSQVCKKEKINVSDEVLTEISENVDGCPRQALVVLDKIRDMPEEDINEILKQTEIVEKQVIDLCRGLIKGSGWNKIAEIVKAIKEDPEKVRYAILGYMSAVLLNGDSGRAAMVIEEFSEPFYNSGKPGLVLACYRCMV